jgi:hypothetical protein
MIRTRPLIAHTTAICLSAALALSLPWIAGAEAPGHSQPPPAPAEDPENSAPLSSQINPLTGLPVSDPAALERRPLAIKISNHPRYVRPQYGLNRADIVYEYYLEYGLTRFIGLFYGEDAERVGPVRSARYFDLHLVRMYKSVFVFANADRQVLDNFLQTDLVNLFVVERPDNCPPMCRDEWLEGYNNLFTDTQGVRQYAQEVRHVDDLRQDLEGLVFDIFPPQGGIPGAAVETTYSPFSYNYWEYDEASGKYLRYQDAEDNLGGRETYNPLVDHLTNSQVSADNVVALLIPHWHVKQSPEIVAMNIWGSGQAYVFRDGVVYQATWAREGRDSPLRLIDYSGDPFPLKPGKTFFQVIGETSRAWQFGDRWRFEFQIP